MLPLPTGLANNMQISPLFDFSLRFKKDASRMGLAIKNSITPETRVYKLFSVPLFEGHLFYTTGYKKKQYNLQVCMPTLSVIAVCQSLATEQQLRLAAILNRDELETFSLSQLSLFFINICIKKIFQLRHSQFKFVKFPGVYHLLWSGSSFINFHLFKKQWWGGGGIMDTRYIEPCSLTPSGCFVTPAC